MTDITGTFGRFTYEGSLRERRGDIVWRAIIWCDGEFQGEIGGELLQATHLESLDKALVHAAIQGRLAPWLHSDGWVNR